jgi:hypothetical protein
VRRERIASVAVALALVLAAVGGGLGPISATQPASATSSEICTLGELVGLSGLDTAADCLRNDKDVEPDYQNLTATDAYATGLGIKDSSESYLTTTNNFVEDTRSVAYSKGKIDLVNAVNNGTGLAQSRNSVNTTVSDYYAQIDYNLVQDWNSKMKQLRYLNNTSVGLRTQAYTGSGWGLNGQIMGFKTLDYRLVNGTVVDMEVMYVDGPDSNYYVGLQPVDTTANGEYGRIEISGNGNTDYAHARIEIQDPDTSQWTEVLNNTRYGKNGQIGFVAELGSFDSGTFLADRFRQQDQQVRDNLAPYAEEVINQYNAGELDSTDIARLDPAVIGQEAATSLDSTGYYGHAAIMLASLGASGNINVSHTVTTGDGTTLNGTVFYTGDDAPETGFETGSTVNTNSYNGTFYMAVAKDDGNASIVNLANFGETFDIDEATNTQTGESVNATKVQTYTYDSTNASALAEEINRLEDLRDRYEEQAAASTGVGINLGTDDKAIIGVIGVAVILLLTRD